MARPGTTFHDFPFLSVARAASVVAAGAASSRLFFSALPFSLLLDYGRIVL